MKTVRKPMVTKKQGKGILSIEYKFKQKISEVNKYRTSCPGRQNKVGAVYVTLFFLD